MATLPQLASPTPFQAIKDSLRQLYLDDQRPWLVGYSGGKDSTMPASLIFDAVLSVPPEQRNLQKPLVILRTDIFLFHQADLIRQPNGA